MKRLALLLLILLLFLAVSCAHMQYALRQQGYDGLHRPWIRVRVLQGNQPVTVSAKGSFIVRAWDNNNENSAYYSASPVQVRSAKGELSLVDDKGNLLEQRLHKIALIADKKTWLYLNGKMFRGIFEFHPTNRDTFYTVNVLNVEDYLRGVLQPEIGNRTEDEFEAVKAQAVAARTYAFVTEGKYPNREYDLINDIGDQVYNGVAGEQNITNRGVKATRGEVLEYDGKLIDAYYHSTCSGHTDNIEDVWDRGPLPYLVSVDDDDFCSWSKYYQWNETFPATEFLDHVRSYLKGAHGQSELVGSRLLTVEALDSTAGGRVKDLKITTDKGSVVLHKDQIRWAIGRHDKPGILPSNNIEVFLSRDDSGAALQVQVTGSGYGHGIGMCQCGAIGMARFGYDYVKILTHYYTGVRIVKLY